MQSSGRKRQGLLTLEQVSYESLLLLFGALTLLSGYHYQFQGFRELPATYLSRSKRTNEAVPSTHHHIANAHFAGEEFVRVTGRHKTTGLLDDNDPSAAQDCMSVKDLVALRLAHQTSHGQQPLSLQVIVFSVQPC